MRLGDVVVLGGLALAACGRPSAPRHAAPASLDSLTAARIAPALLERHTRELSSARYLGRSVGTRGETLTVDYVERAFRRAGLQPGNPDGTFHQRFDLFHQRTASMAGSLRVGGRVLPLVPQRDFVAQLARDLTHGTVDDAPVVFVGYGIAAPELGWDDYKDADVRGKLVVFLLDVPSATAEDSSLAAFRRFGRSYYTRPEYKRQLAARHGAAGTIGVLLDARAFGPSAERLATIGSFELGDDPVAPLHVSLAPAPALALLAAAGLDSARTVAAASRRDFRPRTLGSASFDVRSEVRRLPTRNVVARLEGSDPARRGEYVIVTAHWDARGTDPAARGTGAAPGAASINHGAADNAAGTAGLLAIAEALAAVRPRPPRSVLLMATSAEERGYNGARHYVRHPLYPLDRTVAAVNIDLYGPPVGQSRDVVIWGEGRSTIDALVADVARAQGRRVGPDPVRQQGIAMRMDHMPFNEAGVPGVSLAPGLDLVGRPPGHARRQLDAWVATRYHAPGDTIDAGWDWEGLALDVRTSLLLALRLAREERWPRWVPGAEFARGRRPWQASESR